MFLTPHQHLLGHGKNPLNVVARCAPGGIGHEVKAEVRAITELHVGHVVLEKHRQIVSRQGAFQWPWLGGGSNEENAIVPFVVSTITPLDVAALEQWCHHPPVELGGDLETQRVCEGRSDIHILGVVLHDASSVIGSRVAPNAQNVVALGKESQLLDESMVAELIPVIGSDDYQRVVVLSPLLQARHDTTEVEVDL